MKKKTGIITSRLPTDRWMNEWAKKVIDLETISYSYNSIVQVIAPTEVKSVLGASAAVLIDSWLLIKIDCWKKNLVTRKKAMGSFFFFFCFLMYPIPIALGFCRRLLLAVDSWFLFFLKPTRRFLSIHVSSSGECGALPAEATRFLRLSLIAFSVELALYSISFISIDWTIKFFGLKRI